ncbi:hypothetical protein [Streptomyces sp. NPDC059788]|uniref:hypothetical protein n=1 Tax=Streptomyces sp. NPDC059788 TaxID=3346948 RepID=UPI0036678D51
MDELLFDAALCDFRRSRTPVGFRRDERIAPDAGIGAGRAGFDAFDAFDALVNAARVGVAKPDP